MLPEDLQSSLKHRFRWVQCQLDQISKFKTMRDIRGALNHLPEGLQETYENMLGRIAPQCIRIVREILQWLVCDVSTLTLTELHECLAIELDMDHIDEESQLSNPMDIYDLCGSLIAVTENGGVILAHLSVKDYLLSDAIKKGKASAFALSELEANAENALKCMAYLSFAEFRSGPSRSANDFEARLLSHPFLDHASRYWSTYAENSRSSSTEVQSRVQDFFRPSCRPQFMAWLQVICSELVLDRQHLNKMRTKAAIHRRKRGWDNYPKHATSLYYAASFGIEHVVRALLDEGADVDAMGGRVGATAFHAAALRGHVKVMDLLFQKGADLNKADFINTTALHSAAGVDDAGVIRYLLEHGADADARDARGETAYEWAVLFGNVNAKKVLKEYKR